MEFVNDSKTAFLVFSFFPFTEGDSQHLTFLGHLILKFMSSCFLLLSIDLFKREFDEGILSWREVLEGKLGVRREGRMQQGG